MVFLAMGLMAKPMLVTLPLVLLLLDYWPLGRFAGGPCRRPTPPHCNGEAFTSGVSSLKTELGRFSIPRHLVVEKLPLLALAALSCVIALTQGKPLAANEHLSLAWRMGNALISYVTYLGQSLYPVGLAVLYPRSGLDLPLWKIFGASLILIGITGVVLVWRRRSPHLLVGWLWYLAMMAPVVGFVQIGIQTVADRFTYLPQIGLCIALAWGVGDVCRSSSYRRWACGVASTLALVVLTRCAWHQASFWCDSQTLWTHTLACTSPNSAAHYNFGVALAGQGRLDEAMDHYRKALTIKPDYVEAYNNLGVALAGQGRLGEAIRHYQKVLEIKPDHAEAHNNLGVALTGQGRLDEAAAHYRAAVAIKPDFAEAYNNLGAVLGRQGNLDEALVHFQRALEIKPDFTEAHHNLGMALAGRGRTGEAMTRYRKALEIQPRNAILHR
jgi:Flp pilus assembly protein TadD